MKVSIIGVPSDRVPLSKKVEMLSRLEGDGELHEVKKIGHYVWYAEAGADRMDYLRPNLQSVGMTITERGGP